MFQYLFQYVFWTIDTKTIIPPWKGKYFVTETYTLCVFEAASKIKGSLRLWNSDNKLLNQIRCSCWQYWISLCTLLQRVREIWNKIMLGDKACIHCPRYFTYICPPFCNCKNISLGYTRLGIVSITTYQYWQTNREAGSCNGSPARLLVTINFVLQVV